MEIGTTTVARQYRLMEWVDQIRDCQLRPNGMSRPFQVLCKHKN